MTSTFPISGNASMRDSGRLLSRHELYCTLCENNTGDCTLHNTFADMNSPFQRYAFKRKPYEKDHSGPFCAHVLKVTLEVALLPEHHLPIVAAVDHAVWIVRQHDPTQSGHRLRPLLDSP